MVNIIGAILDNLTIRIRKLEWKKDPDPFFFPAQDSDRGDPKRPDVYVHRSNKKTDLYFLQNLALWW